MNKNTDIIKLYYYKAKVLKTIDGDTIEVSISAGFDVNLIKRVRLLYYDANETRNIKYKPNDVKLAMIQKQWLESELDKHEFIYLWSKKVDSFGRSLGEIFTPDSNSINQMFIDKWPGSEV